MAKKKQEKKQEKKENTDGIMGLHGSVTEQPISETLEFNYMPYAMSVIVSRAIPEIDGFKPSHRKLLYTMYKMGLLTGGRTKSANIPRHKILNTIIIILLYFIYYSSTYRAKSYKETCSQNLPLNSGSLLTPISLYHSSTAFSIVSFS